jgi:hypothetical protein
MPQATAAPGWISQAEQTADTAKWILAGVAGVLAVLLLVGAVRRGRSKSQSKKAMDHLDGANYRDYSVAPKGRKRNEVISGEEERAEEAAPAEEAPAEAAVPENSEPMAETLRRLYNEPVESVKETFEGEAEKAAAEVTDAAEEAAEAVKAEAEPTAQSMQEATRRRRAKRD